jgi:hypothetical protein
MPYVEMGFNALTNDIIHRLENHKNLIKDHYEGIKLPCKHLEEININ